MQSFNDNFSFVFTFSALNSVKVYIDKQDQVIRLIGFWNFPEYFKNKSLGLLTV